MTMHCEFCSSKAELKTIKTVTGEPLHTFDWDKDGRAFKICPDCFTVDTITLKDGRELIKQEIVNNSLYSGRDKKSVLQQLCKKQSIEGEERKLTIANSMKEIKGVSDIKCIEIISGVFSMSTSVVEVLFHNVKRYRGYMKVKKYEK